MEVTIEMGLKNVKKKKNFCCKIYGNQTNVPIICELTTHKILHGFSSTNFLGFTALPLQ